MTGLKSGSHFKVRRRRGSHLGVTGKLPTTLNEHSLFYESLRERDLFVLLAYDPGVLRVEDHPFPIWYGNGKRRRRYTPDARVDYRDGRKSQVIEVKVEAQLEREAEKYEAPFAAARAYCAEHDLEFRVVTDAHMPRPRLTNLRFLLPYRKEAACSDVEAGVRAALDAPMSLEALAKLLEADGVSREDTIAETWRLASLQQITVELDAPLSMTTMVSPGTWGVQL